MPKKKKSPSGIRLTEKKDLEGATSVRRTSNLGGVAKKSEDKSVRRMNNKYAGFIKKAKKGEGGRPSAQRLKKASEKAAEKAGIARKKGEKLSSHIVKLGKFGERAGRKLPIVGAALTGLSLAAKAKKVSAATKKKKKEKK